MEPVEYLYVYQTLDPWQLRYDYFGTIPAVSWLVESDAIIALQVGTARCLVRTSDGTLYAAYSRTTVGREQIYVKRSVDDGVTWIDETLISTTAGMEDNYQQKPALAVDSDDNLHVVWQGRVTGVYALFQIWYAKYDGSWSVPLRISTFTDMEDYDQKYPSIAVDSTDYLHVVWEGRASGYTTDAQIWYAKYDGSWSVPIRISTVVANMSANTQTYPTIAIDSLNNLHVLWSGCSTDYPEWNYQIWYSKYDGSWSVPLRISTFTDMEDYSQLYVSIAINSDDNLHVVWSGKASGFIADEQIWYAKYDGIWSNPLRISTGAGQGSEIQTQPSIAVDSDDYLHVAWQDKRPGDNFQIWYRLYTDSWQLPESIHTGENAYPNIRWSRWPR